MQFKTFNSLNKYMFKEVRGITENLINSSVQAVLETESLPSDNQILEQNLRILNV